MRAPSRRRVRFNALALGATLIALGAALWSGRSAAGTTLPRESGDAIPFTDVHPYGANFFLEREPDPWKREKAVVMAQEGGVRWARQQILWADVQPDEDGAYQWSKYDDLVDSYRRHGIDVIARLDWSPSWARQGFVSEVNNPPDAAHSVHYATFAGAAARHFAGRVRFYQIWNEPNLRTEWGNEPADPVEYAALLAAAAKAIRRNDRHAVVISAPLAPTTEQLELGGNMDDVDYLEALYASGAAEDFDILGANAFGMDRSPDESPRSEELNMRRIELQREVMERNGDADKPIWLGEYGWNAAPADMPANRLLWRRVDESVQAAWTVQGVDWAREHWPWSGVFSIWYFQYHRPAPDKPEAYFRMVDLDFTPRRLFDAVRVAAAGLATARAGEWGERSSPVTADSDWRWEFVEGARGGNAVVAEEAGAALHLRFIGDGVAARAAGAVTWRVDGGVVSATPESGEATVEGLRWQQVAAGLGSGEHTLEAVATGTGAMIDAFRVTGGRGSTNRDRLVAALAVLAAALAVMLGLDLRAGGRGFVASRPTFN